MLSIISSDVLVTGNTDGAAIWLPPYNRIMHEHRSFHGFSYGCNPLPSVSVLHPLIPYCTYNQFFQWVCSRVEWMVLLVCCLCTGFSGMDGFGWFMATQLQCSLSKREFDLNQNEHHHSSAHLRCNLIRYTSLSTLTLRQQPPTRRRHVEITSTLLLSFSAAFYFLFCKVVIIELVLRCTFEIYSGLWGLDAWLPRYTSTFQGQPELSSGAKPAAKINF